MFQPAQSVEIFSKVGTPTLGKLKYLSNLAVAQPTTINYFTKGVCQFSVNVSVCECKNSQFFH